MKIGSSPLAPRPACDDLPTVETRGQCKLPTAHLDERKALETKEMAKELEHHAVDEVVGEGALHVLPKGFAAVGMRVSAAVIHKIATPASALVGTLALKEMSNLTREQAGLRAAAVGRENHDLAMAFVADQSQKGVFPEGYIASRRDTLMGGNAKIGDARHTPHVVNKVIAQMDSAIEANHAGAKQYVSYWATNASAGVREAQARNIRDEASLEAACKDPKLAATLKEDAAFREGIRAGMWQAKTHPQAFDSARSAITSLRDQAAQAQIGRPS